MECVCRYNLLSWIEIAPMSRQTDPENSEEFDEWPDTAQIRHRWLEHGSRGKPRAERPRGERPSKGKSHRTRERDSSEF
jgi:hypothetical protein